MSHDVERIGKSINIIQFLIYIGILILSVGVVYAKIDLKVCQLEQNASITKTDHDNIIALNTKMSSMNEDIQEIKSDIKDIKNHYERKLASNIKSTDLQN